MSSQSSESDEEESKMLLSGKVILDVTHNNVVKKAFFDNKAGKTRDLWLHTGGNGSTEGNDSALQAK